MQIQISPFLCPSDISEQYNPQILLIRRVMENRDNLPGTLFNQKLQEFCIKQGVARSHSGLNPGPVLEFWGNGGRGGPGFGRLSTPEKGDSVGWLTGVVSGVWMACPTPGFFDPGCKNLREKFLRC